MSTRVVLLTLLALTAAPLFAAEPAAHAARTDQVSVIAASPVIPITLAELFETCRDLMVSDDGMSIAVPPQEVLVARVNSDGSVETACVATKKAAEAFMAARTTAAAPTKPQEK